MQDDFFVAQMNRMAGMRYRPSDYSGHHTAVRHLPESILADAVTRILVTQDDFPTPAALLREAEALRPVLQPEPPVVEKLEVPLEVVVPVTNQRIVIHEVWRYDCEHCRDTGRVSWWCGDSQPPMMHVGGRRTCDRHASHYDHDWVGPCDCVPTNPTIQRRLAARATYAQEAAPTRKGRTWRP